MYCIVNSAFHLILDTLKLLLEMMDSTKVESLQGSTICEIRSMENFSDIQT